MMRLHGYWWLTAPAPNSVAQPDSIEPVAAQSTELHIAIAIPHTPMWFAAVLAEIHDVIRVERYSTSYRQRKELNLEYSIDHHCRRNACRRRGLPVRRLASIPSYVEAARTGISAVCHRIQRSADEATAQPARIRRKAPQFGLQSPCRLTDTPFQPRPLPVLVLKRAFPPRWPDHPSKLLILR